MSLNDIKEKYTVIKIEGDDYKIAFDNRSIAKLIELYDCSYSTLFQIVKDINEVGTLEKMLEFDYIGFLKYQPDFDKELLNDYRFYSSLHQKCWVELSKAIQEPDEWEKLIASTRAEIQGEQVKKKTLWTSLISIIKREK